MSTIARKICLIGDFGVGKTSLISRFVDRQFSDQYLSTVGVKISRKVVDLESAKQPTSGAQSLQLMIWDIEGNTKFKGIAPTYLQGAKGAIVVADVTRMETIESLPTHIHNFTQVNPQGVLVVALNKFDLLDEEHGDRLLKALPSYSAHVLQVFSTSAKSGSNVDRLFQTLSNQL
jgi:small GTP-binding protein